MLLWTTRGDMTLTAGSDVTQPILCMFFCCSSLTDRAACMAMSSHMHAASGQLFLFIYIKIDICWLIALANTVPSYGGTGLVGYSLLRDRELPVTPNVGWFCAFLKTAPEELKRLCHSLIVAYSLYFMFHLQSSTRFENLKPIALWVKRREFFMQYCSAHLWHEVVLMQHWSNIVFIRLFSEVINH